MIKVFFSLILITFFASCASSRSSETAAFRSKTYKVNMRNIALNPNGLSAEQIKAISATKPPQNFPVDIAIIFISDGYIPNDLKEELQHGVIQGLKRSTRIDRITIIPKFIIPNNLSFASIQELGIRSLSELVIVFHMDGNSVYEEYKIFSANKIKVSSKVDYMIIDSKTSAILATEELYSEQVYEDKVFEHDEDRVAIKNIILDQTKILSTSINILFQKADNMTGEKK